MSGHDGESELAAAILDLESTTPSFAALVFVSIYVCMYVFALGSESRVSESRVLGSVFGSERPAYEETIKKSRYVCSHADSFRMTSLDLT